LVENLGEKSYILNFYLLLALTCLPSFLSFGGDFFKINAKRGKILGESVRERLICEFKGVKERHI
jgi:hypothetical protein